MNIVGAIKGMIAAAGIGKAIKSTLEAGGNLQQSFGGLDTIYGDAAEAAKQYASEAAAAGISANDYAEQAVSFGASLKQAFAGDTTKAVEAANTAIMDMADNSAKMGTDIGMIQSAYQGFAKQNYTMLDNLKLGYGGTKGEMERLLEDAQKLSGVEYNIDNLGDVYDAIHVIQEDLGLTGVAAAEAEGTFTGSMGAMKASVENLLANLALGNDITGDIATLMGNVRTFVLKNLGPMVGNILAGIPELLSGAGTLIITSLNIVKNNSGEIAQMGIDFVVALVQAIVETVPYLIEAAFNLVAALGEALMNTDWIQVGTDLITGLNESMELAAGEIFGADGNILTAFFQSLTAGLPQFLSVGVEVISNIVNGILENLPSLLTTAMEILFQFTSFLYQSLPEVMNAGVELLLNLVNGIVDNLPTIVTTAVELMASFMAGIGQQLPNILMKGIEIIGKLVAGLIQAIPKLVAAIPQIILAMVKTFLSYDWFSIGKNILLGIKDGIVKSVSVVVEAAKEAAKSIWEAVKSFFSIGSPSKLMAYAGEMIDVGFANGITDNKGLVDSAISSLSNSAMSSLEMSPNISGFEQAQDDRIDTLIEILGMYLPTIASGENQKVVIEADAGRMFRVMQRESIRNTQLVGTGSVLSATT
jgi:phage-related protein